MGEIPRSGAGPFYPQGVRRIRRAAEPLTAAQSYEQKGPKNSPRGKPLGDPRFQANTRAAGHKNKQPFGSCGTIEDPSRPTSAAAPRTPTQTNLTACAAQSYCSSWFGVALWLSTSGLRFTAAQLRCTSSAALAESTGDYLGEGRQAHQWKMERGGRYC